MKYSKLWQSGMIAAALIAVAPLADTAVNGVVLPTIVHAEDKDDDATKADVTTINNFVKHFNTEQVVYSKSQLPNNLESFINMSEPVSVLNGKPGLVGDDGELSGMAARYYSGDKDNADAKALWKIGDKYSTKVTVNVKKDADDQGTDYDIKPDKETDQLKQIVQDLIYNGGLVTETIEFVKNTDSSKEVEGSKHIVLKAKIVGGKEDAVNFANAFYSKANYRGRSEDLTTNYFNHSGVLVGKTSDADSAGLLEKNTDGTYKVHGMAEDFLKTDQQAVLEQIANDYPDLAVKVTYQYKGSDVPEAKLADTITDLKANGGDITETLTLNQPEAAQTKAADSTTQLGNPIKLTLHVDKQATGDEPDANKKPDADKDKNDNNQNAIVVTHSISGAVTVKNDVPDGYVHLYDANGTIILDRALSAGTAWVTDGKRTLNNGQVMYKVSPTEYVLASDVNFGDKKSAFTEMGSVTISKERGIVDVTAPGVVFLNAWEDAGPGFKVLPNRAVTTNTRWFYDKKAKINDATYYRVSGYEWIRGNYVKVE